MSRDPVLDAAYNALDQAIKDVENRPWYWKLLEVEVRQPDHACGPDCVCWKKKRKRKTLPYGEENGGKKDPPLESKGGAPKKKT